MQAFLTALLVAVPLISGAILPEIKTGRYRVTSQKNSTCKPAVGDLIAITTIDGIRSITIGDFGVFKLDTARSVYRNDQAQGRTLQPAGRAWNYSAVKECPSELRLEFVDANTVTLAPAPVSNTTLPGGNLTAPGRNSTTLLRNNAHGFTMSSTGSFVILGALLFSLL